MSEWIPVGNSVERPGAPIDALVRPIDELMSRHVCAADYAGENRALVALMRELSGSPATILAKLAATMLELCNAHSAGVSLLDESRTQFSWPAISGRWADKVGGGTPRDFGPCGTVLDRNAPLLFSRPDRLFPYLVEARPPVEEALLFPFYVEGQPVGTIWAVVHDQDTRFDSEDARIMQSLADFASGAFQVLQGLARAEASRQSDARLAAIVEGSSDAIVSKTLDGTITSWNKSAEQLFGYTAEEAIGQPITILIPPERKDEEPRIIERIRSGERVQHYETVRRRKDGTLVQVSLSISPVRNAQHEIVGASKIARDITDHKQAEQAKHLLLREMKHRIKNTLATVQSLATQTFRSASTAERDVFVGRLHALAGSHDLLTNEDLGEASLHDIMKHVLAPFSGGTTGTRCRIDGPVVALNANDAVKLSMAAHELATNAAKYGALSNATGSVNLTWTRMPDAPVLKVLWTETGGPPVRPPERRGFGSVLIERAFGADCAELDYDPAGLKCTILVPINA
jgi:PAS domain S-box-containing protein